MRGHIEAEEQRQPARPARGAGAARGSRWRAVSDSGTYRVIFEDRLVGRTAHNRHLMGVGDSAAAVVELPRGPDFRARTPGLLFINNRWYLTVAVMRKGFWPKYVWGILDCRRQANSANDLLPSRLSVRPSTAGVTCASCRDRAGARAQRPRAGTAPPRVSDSPSEVARASARSRHHRPPSTPSPQHRRAHRGTRRRCVGHRRPHDGWPASTPSSRLEARTRCTAQPTTALSRRAEEAGTCRSQSPVKAYRWVRLWGD